MSDVSKEWLPDLVLMSEYDGDWDRFLQSVYECFEEDFVKNKPEYEGRRLGLKKYPIEHEKEATFWHMTSEGANEADRTPDIRRMERICWPKPIIDNAKEKEGETVIKVWRNIRRKNDSRILLWLESEQYLVVLADRGDYILPWTAYEVTHGHSQRKLQKEYEKYWASMG